METRPWAERAVASPVYLLADARSTPPRVAAVLYADGEFCYCDYAPPDDLVGRFQARDDGQIAGLEILAVAVGLSTWADRLRGRDVVIYSDNAVAEFCLKKGSAKALDHCASIHAFWVSVLDLDLRVWIERAPTSSAACARPRSRPVTSSAADDNLADLPSREEYHLLRALGARACQPRLARGFLSLRLPELAEW